MSEAVSSSEIEDVLSSIRRLVSDDLRPDTPSAMNPPSARGDKLLLTPALRVVQSQTTAEDAPAIDAVVAAVSAGVDQQADDWEPEAGDTALDMPMDAESAEIWEDVPVIDAYAEPLTLHPAQRSDAAGEERAEEAPMQEMAEAAPLPGWAQTAPSEEDDSPRADPWAGTATVEPDSDWADAAEAAVLRELAEAPPRQDDGSFAGHSHHLDAREGDGSDLAVDEAADDGEVPVDEAMLREIVRDVLREELQGRLGERITRNIRKLVRAEIARVIAEEDLI